MIDDVDNADFADNADFDDSAEFADDADNADNPDVDMRQWMIVGCSINQSKELQR